MTCTLESVTDRMVDDASKVLLKGAKEFTQVEPGVFELKTRGNLSLGTIYERSKAGQNAVAKWATEQYGPKWQYGWTTIDRSNPSKITMRLAVPEQVSNLIKVKLGLKTLAEANELALLTQEAAEVSFDPILNEQEFVSDAELAAEYNEVFSKLGDSKSSLLSDFYYDENVEFDYDRTKETNVEINDELLYRLLNDSEFKYC